MRKGCGEEGECFSPSLCYGFGDTLDLFCSNVC